MRHLRNGGEGFLGPWGGRTKNIDVLMIVMLKLANGFSDYEQVSTGARIVAYCLRRLQAAVEMSQMTPGGQCLYSIPSG